MRLTDDEKAMLEGKEGLARQKAMNLLVRYGEALGAERLVDTNNVGGYMVAKKQHMMEFGSLDALFSEFNLDSSEVVEFAKDKVKVFSCQFETTMDPDFWEIQGKSSEDYRLMLANEEYLARGGVALMCTCTPYLVGNVPIKGEHCAWMESSAVVYINSVLGARTNAEGNSSATAAMLTGKIPYWGFHIDENRLGTHLIDVECIVESQLEWGLLGYYAGRMVKERVPVINGIKKLPNLIKLKQLGAAAASSGGVEMYHIPGITAEARTVEEAFGKKQPVERLSFGTAERNWAYEALNATGKDTNVDFVMFGCPHASIEEIWEICKLLEGKHIHTNTALWIFTPRGLREIADRNGFTKIIKDAGGVLMSDTCPALGQLIPKGVKVMATNSGKQAHYLPSVMGVQAWYGTTGECVDAAITGRWRGVLK
ncbi:aconitase X catalytic domain-containing protein [Sporomusa sp.]|uniref:aconitase X catalytic domain-containing protein n=1 Tax=Sporomusa sp. TaxID=2078658 RepID=UPI002C24809F|nr:aconitase X catalytic domain-containing protein [Sporomusa sp.]HWR06315.1 aconitase X catalytic domain-containing protein [Sporomusa sp.]